jgi:hypothetical protein
VLYIVCLKYEIVPPDQYNHLLVGDLQHKSFCPEVLAQPHFTLAGLCQTAISGNLNVLVNFPAVQDSFRNHID